MKKLMPLLIDIILLTACQQVPVGSSPTAPALTLTFTASSTPTSTFTPTITPTTTLSPTPESTPTPEIGGTTAVILFQDFRVSGVPSVFTPYLVPTSPDKWASLETLTMSNGQPIPWGGAITYLDDGDPYGQWPLIPGLVRGVVQYSTYAGSPLYGEIIEFPVHGGSIFDIGIIVASVTNSDLPTSKLIPGAYPVECTGGVVCKGEQVYVDIKSGRPINGPDMVSLLQSLIGKMALFPMRPYPEDRVAINAIAHGSLNVGDTADFSSDTLEIWYP